MRHAISVLPTATLLLLSAASFALNVPDELNLGELAPGTTTQVMILLSNMEPDPVSASALSGSPFLSLQNSEITIPAGEQVSLIADATIPVDAEPGDLVAIVTIVPETGETLATVVRARVSASAEAAARRRATERAIASGGFFQIDIYMDVTCPKCRELTDRTLPELARGSASVLVIEEFDVLVPAHVDSLMQRLAARGASLEELPVAFVTAPASSNTQIFWGFEGIARGTSEVIAASRSGADPGSGQEQTRSTTTDYLTIGAIVGAGLLDGINPCAFSTMLFLISMLAVAGRTRREILLIGAIYSATVFTGYVAAGFGLFAGVRTLMVFPLVVVVVRWMLFALLLGLASLSVRDAVLARQGRTAEMTLQLPDQFKRRVHSVVRTGTRSASLVGGTILLGLGVTVFEFSCTGQVYVPVIMHLARSGSAAAIGLLLLYNVAFIVPLLAVFAMAYAGVSMKKLGNLFAGNLVAVKLSLAAVFLGFALLTILV